MAQASVWRRWVALGLVLALAAPLVAAPVIAAESRHRFSYEVIPAVGILLPNIARSDYGERAEFASEVLVGLVPELLRAFRVAPERTQTEVTPGGYRLQTNPSLQTELEIDPREATRLAAGLGYVLSQDSVLVTDFADHPSPPVVAAVMIAFPRRQLTAALAHRFFLHAATVSAGLGGGYTAFGDQMGFFNLRDSTAAPWSGLDDQMFTLALTDATATFAPVPVAVAGVTMVRAYLVENDWARFPAGESYLDEITGPAAPEPAWLESLRDRHRAMVRATAGRYGWR